jgi:hypothetical protein
VELFESRAAAIEDDESAGLQAWGFILADE